MDLQRAEIIGGAYGHQFSNMYFSQMYNINRTVKCYFKRVYTTKTFTIDIDPCKSVESLYNKILTNINNDLYSENPLESINDFDIIIADNHEEGEAMPPNNICLKNMIEFLGYNTDYAFYVRKKNEEIECPICYTNTQLRRGRFACRHCFCNDCTNGWLHNCNLRQITASCPMCRSELIVY